MFFQTSMQTGSIMERFSIFLTVFLAMITITIVTHKIDQMSMLHILPSLKLLYVLFFGICGYLIFAYKKKIRAVFFITLPSVLILATGLFFTRQLHYIFYVFVGLYFISIGIVLTYIVHKNRIGRSSASRLHTSIFLHPQIILILCIMITFFICGFYRLDKGSFVDEKLWTYGVEKRIEKYWNNIGERDWLNTRPSDKPGVTLAIVSGAGLLWTTPSDFYHNFNDATELAKMLFTMRLPILLFCTLAIPLLFFLVQMIFDRTTAVIATTFIGLSPILIGISRIINPDAIGWIVMSLTFLSFFAYIRHRHMYLLYLTGFLLGLSLLTKYIANLFIVFFILEMFTFPLMNQKIKDKHTYFRQKFIDIAIIIFIAIATFYIFYPGTWLAPDRLLTATIWSQAFLPVWKPFMFFCLCLTCDHFLLRSLIMTKTIRCLKKLSFVYHIVPVTFATIAIFVLINTSGHMSLVNFETLLAAPKNNGLYSIFSVFASGFYTTLYSITPLALLGMGIAIIAMFDKKNSTVSDRSFLWHSLLFVLIFYAGSAASMIASTVRYQIILYPIFFVIAAYGIHYTHRAFHLCKYIPLTLLMIIILSLHTLWTIKPFYLSYSNTLLPPEFIVNPKDMGDGNFEIATYLNSLPDASQLRVWSDKNGICAFFVGYCNSRANMGEFDEQGAMYDYYVISRGSAERIIQLTDQRLEIDPHYPLRLDRLYREPQNSVYSISPGNRVANYYRVIPGTDLVIMEK